jgi:sodium transport system permease protein
MFLLSGSAVVAIDTLAGEKERGTLETLLTTAVARAEIVAAKHLLILTVAAGITIIQVGNLLVYVGFELIPTTTNFAAAVTPATAVLLLLLYLPVAALVASVLLVVSGRARTYKEAQLLFFPVFLVGMLPGLAALLPGLPLRSAIVLVPVANISVAVKDTLVGRADWPFAAIAWIVTAAAAAWAGRVATRGLSTERLIAPVAAEAEELLGGPALFPRHVLRWFAVLWALLLVLGVNLETAVDVRVQAAVNIVGLFVGGSVLMIRRYRLNVREALALRPVRPAVWLAVVMGVPAAMLTGIGVSRLANLFLPVPRELVESFGEALVPESVPFWQLLLFLTILPGIGEEIAFRGVLLHGLHRRLRPVGVALAVGLVFGLFHTSLFRIFPTAYLGVILAAVVLLTGSIFPAMLWHALNNAMGLAAGKYGWAIADLEPLTYVEAAAVLALCFWIIWRNRTPYPGLRPWRASPGDR